MPACAFAHHSTAANAAARRAGRSALANAPCTSLLRRDAAAPLPLLCLLCPCPAQPGTALLCPGLDWPGQGTVRAPGCEMRFAGVRSRKASKQRAGANECSHLGRAPKLARLSFGTLGLRGMRGMRFAINVFAASKQHSLRRNPH